MRPKPLNRGASRSAAGTRTVLLAAAAACAVLFVLVTQERWLDYLLALLIAVKTKAVVSLSYLFSKAGAFLSVSKKKFVLYVKTMTAVKALSVGVKRFFIDNYVSKWIERNLIAPVKGPLVRYARYYAALNPAQKVKKALLFFVPAGLLAYGASAAGVLEHLVFYAEIKAVVIAFFKLLWLFGGKVLGVVYTLFFSSWIAPLLQIFALSYLLEKLEKIPVIGRPVRALFEMLDRFFSALFSRLGRYWRRYVERYVSVGARRRMRRFGRWMELRLEQLRHRNELFLMQGFMKAFLAKGGTADYFASALEKYAKKHPDEPIDTAARKRDFLDFVNRHTRDNIDIVGFFSFAPYPPVRDVLLIESFASGNREGNSRYGIRADSFWVLNLGEKPVILRDDAGLRRPVKPGKLKLVHTPAQRFDVLYVETGAGAAKRRVYLNPISTQE